MRVINNLRGPGEIRSVRLTPNLVVVRTVAGKEIVYRRVEDESNLSKEGQLRRCPLPSGL